MTFDEIKRLALGAISGAFAETETDNAKRSWFLPHTYTIRGEDGSPYLTRTLFPRLRGRRALLHHIHRADERVDHLHNHPWETAAFLILSGGYTECRRVDGHAQINMLRPGDINRLDQHDFHSVIEVLPNTWTAGVVGARIQDWGFLVDGRVVPNAEYLGARARPPHPTVPPRGY